MSDYGKSFLNAMDTLIEQRVSNLPYDRTIRAKIFSCEDQLSGKYKISYQDSKFIAYSENTNLMYPKDTDVYILIPGGDMESRKLIVGSVKTLGENYLDYLQDILEQMGGIISIGGTATTENDNTNFKYENGVIKARTTGCENNGEQLWELYDVNNQSNILDFSNEELTKILQASTHLSMVATFKEEFKSYSAQTPYGFRFTISFAEGDTQTIEIDNLSITGVPFKHATETRQRINAKMEDRLFKRIEKVEFFCGGNKNKQADNTTLYDTFEITISDIKMSGCTTVPSDTVKNSNYIQIFPEDGFSIPEGANYIPIEPVYYSKGIEVSEPGSIEYYRFIEDLTVVSGDEKYSTYGGNGWRCLNTPATDGKHIPDTNPLTWLITGNEFLDVKHKCKIVGIYKGEATEKIFDIECVKNKGNGVSIEFYRTKEEAEATIKNWDDSDDDKEVKEAARQEAMKQQIDNIVLTSETLPEIWLLRRVSLSDTKTTTLTSWYYKNVLGVIETVKEYDKEQDKLVDAIGNCIKVTNKDFYQSATYYCNASVYNKNDTESPIGHLIASAEMTNVANGKGYTAVIENSLQSFKYNASGVSPTSEINDAPQQELPLNFRLYNGDGEDVTMDLCLDPDATVEWVIPCKSLLKSEEGDLFSKRIKPSRNSIDPKKPFGDLEWSVDDARSFDPTRAVNSQIKLVIGYKNRQIIESTNFLFTKDGETGTNGTEWTAKIIAEEDKYAYWKWDGETCNLGNSLKFSVAVYQGTEIVEPNTVTWKMLKKSNEASLFKTEQTPSGDKVTLSQTAFVYSEENGNAIKIDRRSITNTYSHNVLQAQINCGETTIYATYPVISLFNYDDKEDPFEELGTQYVVYSSENSTPTYAKKNYIFKPPIEKSNDIFCNFGNLTTIEKGDKITEIGFVPPPSYDGYATDKQIRIVTATEDSVVKFVQIPIAASINRYSNPQFNAWDGNSIETEDGTILAPQIGAGEKTADNAFSGVVMGVVQKGNNKETGLFGYSKGQQSFSINSDDGSVSLGTSNSGSIKITPGPVNPITHQREDSAIIASGNYSISNKKGMSINLAAGTIETGSQAFEVDRFGHLIAKGGGSIAGWDISDTSLTKGKVGISSNNDADENLAFWAGSSTQANAKFKVNFRGDLTAHSGDIGGWTIDATKIYVPGQVYLNNGTGSDKAIWAGAEKSGDAPFSVTFGGALTATSGQIGGWNIGNESNVKGLYSNKKGFNSDLEDQTKTTGVYVGPEGIGLGARKNGESAFYVTSGGELHAHSGSIGGWTLGEDYIKQNGVNAPSANLDDEGNLISGKYTLSSNKKIGSYFGSQGLQVGQNFAVFKNGHLVCKDIDATGGKIGGWTIDGNNLKSGSITIDGDANQITGSGWTLNKDALTLKSSGSISGNGCRIGGGGTGHSTYFSPSSVFTDAAGNTTLQQKINDLADGRIDLVRADIEEAAVKRLLVENFSLKGSSVAWRQIQYVYSVRPVKDSEGKVTDVIANKAHIKILSYSQLYEEK